jgi:ComF family protein
MNPAAATLRTLKGWGMAAVDFLYPPVCPLCWRRLTPEDDTVCFDCRAELALRPEWRCPRCGAAGLGEGPRPGKRCRLCPPEGSAWRGALSVAGYHDFSQRSVQLFKYHGRIELGELMARLMVECLEEPLADLQNRIDWVVPVPLHWTRRLTRGFNQSDLLARALAGAYKLRYQPKLLKRKKYTKRQALVPRERRAQNVEGAFALGRPGKFELRDAGVLLVDDVVTTGETVNVCAKVLMDAGAREVWVASFARAGMDRAGDEE